MLKKFNLALSLLIGCVGYAQNENDVLRYSTTDIYGSARFEAMAGSFGALGADFSAIQINPAGMARFSNSQISFSLNNANVNTEALYNGVNTHTRNNSFKISNLGFVLTNDVSNKNDGRLFNQFTFGYTRLKNFDYNSRYEGQNFYSLLDVFANSGQGIDPESIYSQRPFTTGLAYDVYALDYDPNTGEYYSRLTMGDMYHNREMSSSGGIGEFHIGYSENYMNQWYYGGSIGIRRFNYEESYNHNERLLDTVGTTLRSFNYLYDQSTTGTGYNLKLGVIYLPTDNFRVGFAFESPTIATLEDNWRANMTANHDYGTESVPSEYVPEGQFEYRVKTPMKLRGSFAYIFNYRGAINIDLEFARFDAGKLKPANTMNAQLYSFQLENQEVSNQFRSVLNTRVGFEYMVFRDVFVRAGYALLPQPYKNDIGNTKAPNQTFAGGLGWKKNNIMLDLSYRLLKLNSDYYAFDPSQEENRAIMTSDLHHVVFTFNYKF
ncbi:MAG: outer membrane protein transport protein [Brumimicrobium sp.]